jgi:hypothetical protein
MMERRMRMRTCQLDTILATRGWRERGKIADTKRRWHICGRQRGSASLGFQVRWADETERNGNSSEDDG